MSEFEFISVFVSIVLAFAMAELLMAWGRLIREHNRVHKPSFFIGWTIWLLLLMCFHYLGIWEFQAVDFELVGQLVLLLLPPIILVLLTFVLAPERTRGKAIDLEEHYFSIRHWLFSLAILFFVAGTIADMMLPDFGETWISRISLRLIIVITLGLLIVSRNRILHYGVLTFNVGWLILGSIFREVRAL